MQFKIGDKAVFPAHGIGVIKRIETRIIGGVPQDFYVLHIQRTGATLMIPTNACERHGMRPVLSVVDVDKVYRIVCSPPKLSHTTWHRRFREFNDKLRSGSLIETAEVLRDLYALKADKDLSYGEKKMLDMALRLIVDEVAEATGKTLDTVELELMDAINAAEV